MSCNTSAEEAIVSVYETRWSANKYERAELEEGIRGLIRKIGIKKVISDMRVTKAYVYRYLKNSMTEGFIDKFFSVYLEEYKPVKIRREVTATVKLVRYRESEGK